jgi:transketolase
MSDWQDPKHALCVNTIRLLALDSVQKANSGHPGLPMGSAPMAYVLWSKHLKHNPADPAWANRDRFVLSGGHGSALLYTLLHLSGYAVSMDDLKAFRQWESKTPGHPEFGVTPGVEATTGPLGQGEANAVGMAIAERALANLYNRPGSEIVDHHTYALVSDGDIMEGITAESCSLAGHLKLGKLIYLYDANDISLDGPTSLSFDTEDVAKRFEAYGWQVLTVAEGDTDLAGIDRAIDEAKADTARPSLIIVKTTIGFGSPKMQGSSNAHGAPLGPDEVAATKKNLGWDPDKHFFVPDEARAVFAEALERGKAEQSKWQGTFAEYAQAQADLAAHWRTSLSGELPAGWDADIPSWAAGEKTATRDASGKVINAIAPRVPWMIGGDADLSSSTKTLINGAGNFEGQGGAGRNIRFGVREHAMGSLANGMAYHGGLRPFVATFFVFSDYMRPPTRLAAMCGLPVIYVWTHDSVGVGEDGPTHQPIEHLAILRALPNMTVIRPCDANETAEAWKYAMTHTDGPTALVLTRQKLPAVDRSTHGAASGLQKGAYVLKDPDGGAFDAIIIATGSEVELALKAQMALAGEGIRVRVVSMPSWEAFARQSDEYRDSVLPAAVRARVSVEALTTFGWQKWVGSEGRSIGIDRFGASAPGPLVMEKLGITVDAVCLAAKAVLGK